MKKVLLAGLRILIGWVFLWAFLDKLFGLGFSTVREIAWIFGNSPTQGFLANSTYGPFTSLFQNLASSNLVSWLFMLGLLFVGLTMILGVGMRLGATFGSLLLLLMWISMFPPRTNPFIDSHWFYAFALIISALFDSGKYFGFGDKWAKLKIVKKYKILR